MTPANLNSAPWTPDEDARLRQMCEECRSAKEMARTLGRSVSSVKWRVYRALDIKMAEGEADTPELTLWLRLLDGECGAPKHIIKTNKPMQDNITTATAQSVAPSAASDEAARKEANHQRALKIAAARRANKEASAPVQAAPSNVAVFRAIAERLADTYARKNADYGDSFGQSVERYGHIAALTRLSDKFRRAEHLMLGKGEPNYESLADTLGDLATYAIMTLMTLSK